MLALEESFNSFSVGAESSFNLREILRGNMSDALQMEIIKRKLLVFRDQDLSPEEQVSLTNLLGTPQVAWDDRNRDPKHPEIQVIENTYKGGSYHYSRKRLMSTVRYWHADTSFLKKFTRFTILKCVKAPELFGETNFVNTYLSLRDLPDNLRRIAADAWVEHSFSFVFGDLLNVRNDARDEEIPNVMHPLVMTDEFDQESLYLSELTMISISGLDSEEGDKYITKICEFSKQRKFRYNHVWCEGDIVIWDNMGIMHRGDFADPDYPRKLHRTTVAVGDEAKFRRGLGLDTEPSAERAK